MANLFFIWVALAALGIAGQVTNIVWLFNNYASGITGEFILALVGVPLAPIGVIHGILQWF